MTDPIKKSSFVSSTDWGLRAPKRSEPLPTRPHYDNLIARNYADQGHTKFAELVEVGHGCAACHVTHQTNGVPANALLDLDRYARVTAMTRGARSGVEIFQTAFMGALSSLQGKLAASAYRIRVEGYGTTARDTITLQAVGEEMAKNPVARRAYAQVQRHNTEVVLDFKTIPKDAMGRADWRKNQIIVYVAKHPNPKTVVGTLVHETSHIHRFSHGHVNNLRDEFRAHAREFFYEHGRRPNSYDRKILWRYVRQHYPELE